MKDCLTHSALYIIQHLRWIENMFGFALSYLEKHFGQCWYLKLRPEKSMSYWMSKQVHSPSEFCTLCLRWYKMIQDVTRWYNV